MSRFHHPPVDADDACGRQIAGRARAGAVVALFVFIACTSALMDWSGQRYSSARLMPSALEFEPAAGIVQTLPAASQRVVRDAAPEAAPAADPTEADLTQQAYATHGG